jgi:hypothetical protein
MTNGRPYTTVSYKDKILQLRHAYTDIKKSELDETWKRKGLIKIAEYNGKRNDLKEMFTLLHKKGLHVPIIYGKHIIIQGELYFWAIFMSDERVRQAQELSKKDGVENGWEILSTSKSPFKKKEIRPENLLSTKLNAKEKGKNVIEKSTL